MYTKLFRISLLLWFFLCNLSVMAHMSMFKPTPRGHKSNPYTKIDYDLNAPLNPSSKPFACGGTSPSQSVLTVRPGQSIQVEIEGGTPHNGGHCEFSISYDNKNFVSLKTVLRECLRSAGRTFSVPLPPSLPGGEAVFSWSWVNAAGNREFYQNCADITIDAPAKGALKGPRMVVANLPGYPTIVEMISGMDDGSSLYSNRPSIEIAPSTSSTVRVVANSFPSSNSQQLVFLDPKFITKGMLGLSTFDSI